MKYSLDDLIRLAKIGSFGNATNNQLALQAFLRLKYLEEKIKELDNNISVYINSSEKGIDNASINIVY